MPEIACDHVACHSSLFTDQGSVALMFPPCPRAKAVECRLHTGNCTPLSKWF